MQIATDQGTVRTSMRHNGRPYVTRVLLFCLLAVIATYPVWRDRGNLLPRSTKLIELETRSGEVAHEWLSSREVLVHRETRPGEFELRAYDVSTCNDRLVRRFDSALNKLFQGGFKTWRLSPDRNWILVQQRGAVPIYVAVSMVASRHVMWK